MKFLLMTVLICFAVLLAVQAVPIEEAIPEGIEGVASDKVDPSGDSSFLLKFVLLKKLLFLG